MGFIGANPNDVPARTTAERIARGVGGGVAATMAPEVELVRKHRAATTGWLQ
jgi:hypothetical protein